MYIVTKEQIEDKRKKYKNREDYLEQMKKELRKEIKVKPVRIDDLKYILKRNIDILIEYSNLKDITEDYIDSLFDEEVKELMKVYQESLTKKTEELIKEGKLRKSFLE